MRSSKMLFFFAALAATLTGCGSRVSVHFHEDENFNVTAYGAEKDYTRLDLQLMAEDEVAWICGGDTFHFLGEQSCDLGDGQRCYSAVYCCEPPTE